MQKVKVVKGYTVQDFEHMMNQAIETMYEEGLVLGSWDYVPELNAIIMCFEEPTDEFVD